MMETEKSSKGNSNNNKTKTTRRRRRRNSDVSLYTQHIHTFTHTGGTQLVYHYDAVSFITSARELTRQATMTRFQRLSFPQRFSLPLLPLLFRVLFYFLYFSLFLFHSYTYSTSLMLPHKRHLGGSNDRVIARGECASSFLNSRSIDSSSSSSATENDGESSICGH